MWGASQVQGQVFLAACVLPLARERRDESSWQDSTAVDGAGKNQYRPTAAMPDPVAARNAGLANTPLKRARQRAPATGLATKIEAAAAGQGIKFYPRS